MRILKAWLSVLAVAVLALSLASCGKESTTTKAEPAGGATKSEHPKSEHPKAEHPKADSEKKADHPKSEHPKSEHPN